MTAKLKWLCRRGMKELDTLLETYLYDVYPHASPERQAAFVQLLDYQDPLILDLLFGRITDANPDIQAIIQALQQDSAS